MQVLKSPPPVSGSIPVSLEASSLQFLSLYLSSTSNLPLSSTSTKIFRLDIFNPANVGRPVKASCAEFIASAMSKEELATVISKF